MRLSAPNFRFFRRSESGVKVLFLFIPEDWVLGYRENKLIKNRLYFDNQVIKSRAHSELNILQNPGRRNAPVSLGPEDFHNVFKIFYLKSQKLSYLWLS